MARVTQVKWGLQPKDKGEFHCESYNLFDEDERKLYARFRTDANNAANGITIDNMREYSRKTIECAQESGGDGDQNMITTTTEDIILVVQYWQKPPEKQGDTDEEIDEARQAWRRDGSIAR